ncbi:DUF1971 domain-containing protein [Phyllobacterium sp. YR531]|uniref:DUF1971 domain-containing protein n=1 Tax=Phyllobacterium sp. YR531 TaxID=1144343 RepID=UPI00026FA967|nr:DUF1971 domain-containing protein [Phyllobacterium sp. YR531]EJN05976.1 hemoglobin like protein [Phyllobacterium sp. YR531]
MTQLPIMDEAALPNLLEVFYDRVRKDALLGPVFNAAIEDWPGHLSQLADFWSSVMLTTGRYKGNPAMKHAVHAKQISPEMFDRWLALWTLTTDEMLPQKSAHAIQDKARRIAETLKVAIGRATLHHERFSAPYRSTPLFDADTLPDALLREHRTKSGVWGVIRVLEGTVRYHVLDEAKLSLILTSRNPGIIHPEQPHRVEPIGMMKMRIEFYNHKPVLAD